VKRRIWKFYRRDATVIFPPVDVPATWDQVKALQEKAKNTFGTQPYYVYVNRLAISKHPELAVKVCTKLKLPLKLVGSGPMLTELKKMAGQTVEFFTDIPDEQLHVLYAGAKALIYPVEDEDFGIVPVEAMGYGVPVIAHRSGGPRETVVEGKTGLFFDELTIAGVEVAIKKFEKLKFDQQKIHTHALQFSKEKFQKKIQAMVELGSSSE
jgi:glycosyltransferase involved in cell wall biosynthesis